MDKRMVSLVTALIFVPFFVHRLLGLVRQENRRYGGNGERGPVQQGSGIHARAGKRSFL